MSHRAYPFGTWALVAVALVIPLIQWWGGVYLLGAMRADDGAFAVSTLRQFETELANNSGMPSWSFSGNMGVGSPIFYFYPPGAYAFAALVHLLIPGSPDAFVMGASAFAAILLLIGACAAWMRPYVGWTQGFAAGGICALMPYIALINPQRRLAFAEMIAAPLWPLAFMAVDCGASAVAKTTLYVALVVAAFAVIHVPSLILCTGLLPLYAGLKGGSRGEVVRRVAGVGAGLVLGLGLAAVYLVPAFKLQGTLPLQWADVGFTSSLLSLNSMSSSIGRLRNVALLLPVCAALMLAFAGRRSKPTYWAVLGTLCFATVLTTPLAEPLWIRLAPLHRVQFPWRLLQPVSVLGTVAIVLQLPKLGSNARRVIIAAFIGLGLISAIGSYHFSAHGGSAVQRTEDAVQWPDSQAPEYFPRQGASDWVSRQRAGESPAIRAAELQAECLNGHRPPRRDHDSLTVDVSGCKGRVRLPVFAFPGWTAAVGTVSANLATDRQTGLLTVDLPKNAASVKLSRIVLLSTMAGLELTLGFIAVLLVLAIGVRVGPRWRSPAGEALSERRET